MTYEKAWMVGGMLVASLCGGILTTLATRDASAQQSTVVTASQINLVDNAGALRGVLSANDERGFASLAFYDAVGEARSLFGLEGDGTAFWELRDPGGTRLGARVRDNDARLVVGNMERQGLFASVGGGLLLQLGLADRSRLQMQVGEDGAPSLVLFANDGQRAAAVTVAPDDTPLITLYEAGRPRTTLGVVQHTAVLNMTDGSQPRLVIGVADDGRASVSFLDESGQIVQSVP